MKRTLFALIALIALSAHAADRYAYCPGGEYVRTIADPRGRNFRGTIYAKDVTDERLAKDDLFPVVVVNSPDPATHVATGQSAELVGGEYRVTYTLATVEDYAAAQEAAKQAAKSAALKTAENTYLAAPADPKTLEDGLAKLKAALAVLEAGGRLSELPKVPHK